MKRYLRWVVFGLIAVGLIALLVVFGANAKLREKMLRLMLELKVKTSIQDLKEKAATASAKAKDDSDEGVEAEKAAKEAEAKVSQKKEELRVQLTERGLSADEIADRFRKLDI